MITKKVTVLPYNPEWSKQFLELKSFIYPHILDFALSIEHVGSTSVVDLAAKPVIDIDIIIPDMSFLARTIEKLASIGYEHRGNQGIIDREVFKSNNPVIKHNLYVCPKESIALKNHLCLRDSLRANSNLRDEYSALKFRLAEEFPQSIDEYVEGKTDFILKILETNGLNSDRLEEIRKMNLSLHKIPFLNIKRETVYLPEGRVIESRSSAYGLCIANNEILLVQSAYNDLWELPGGKLDAGETALEAMRREFREETGIQIPEQEFVLVGTHQEYFYVDPTDNYCDSTMIFYRFSHLGEKSNDLIDTAEVKNIAWFNESSIKTIKIHPISLQFIKMCLPI